MTDFQDIRVLMICNESLFPANHGGRLRLVDLACWLASQFQLSLLHPLTDSDANVVEPPWQTYGLPVQSPQFLNRFSTKPRLGLQVLHGHDDILRAAVSDFNPNVIVWSHSYLPAAVPRVFEDLGSRSIIDFANLEQARFASLARNRRGLHKVSVLLEMQKAKLWEPKVAKRAAACVALNPAEFEVISNWSSNTLFCPQGLNIRSYSRERLSSTILMMGSMDYEPNVSGLRAIVPALERLLTGPNSRDGCRLVIAGRRANTLEFLPKVPQIEILSDPEDDVSLYMQASVALAPARTGGGAQRKIMRALEFGLPVVAHEFALETLDSRLTALLKPITFRDDASLVRAIQLALEIDFQKEFRSRLLSVAADFETASLFKPLGQCIRIIAGAHT